MKWNVWLVIAELLFGDPSNYDNYVYDKLDMLFASTGV